MNNRYNLSFIFVIISLLIAFSSCSTSENADWLKQGFINPPDSARPGVYWYIMDGNFDRQAITEDLESMKKAGIGYAILLEVNTGIPRGKVDFMSDEWQDLFGHAIKEAERLGIKILLGTGPGWAGSGGPWISPDMSMKHLVGSDTVVTGPSILNTRLSVPDPRKPFFGEGSLTPELKRERDNWYRDVRILAFPTPPGRERIPDIDEKALYYRAPYTSQPGVLPYIPSFASYTDSDTSIISKNKILDLSGMYKPDGVLQWNVPPGKWTVMRFVERNNGSTSRPAPLPGLGFESDKFDTSALHAHYNAYIGKLIKRISPAKSSSGGGWTMLHIDSWEMGAQNWTENFIEEFIKRRGYDPLLFLPVYKGYIINSREESERFLWDVRQTSNELITENHAGAFKKMGRRNNFTLSVEPYDMNPASDLDLGSVADMPMGEFWSEGFGFNSSFSCIEAASIAHFTGKTVVAAEAFTSNGDEAWKMYPGIMKNQGDWAFSIGINKFFFHTFVHKALGDQYIPGMTMGQYGVHWDRGQSWWPLAGAYHKYITRCQYLLSQGIPVADILYLAPEGAPSVFRPPLSALEGSDTLPDKKGYSFDGCSPLYLISHASVISKRIIFPGGSSYKLLVLPDIPTMTPELLNKIDMLIKTGAVVIGFPPVKSPSLSDYPECDRTIHSMSEHIWGTDNLDQENFPKRYLNGMVFIPPGKPSSALLNFDPLTFNIYPDYNYTAGVLKEIGVAPDFTSSGCIRYTHRSVGNREIYFISNRTGNEVTDTCLFRDGSMYAELWDPLTGEIRSLHNLHLSETGIALPVKLEAWQSYFIVFYTTLVRINARSPEVTDFPASRPVMDLPGPWKVEFDTSFGAPSRVIFDTLTDWAVRKEQNIRYYSGIARYSISFNLPDSLQTIENKDLFIDLGKVKNLARVILNGTDLGIIWTPSCKVRINRAVKKKDNTLEIEVANLWINRLIGDENMPWDGIEGGRWPDWLLNKTPRPGRRYTFTTYRYYKKDDPLVVSGLLGPVRILESE
jgi:hypothetical protein